MLHGTCGSGDDPPWCPSPAAKSQPKSYLRAPSTEQEFIADYKAKFERFPRSQIFWSSKVASRIGEKMATRLKEVGVLSVQIDAQEELSRPIHYRKMARPFFESVKFGGISVADAEDLIFLG